MQKTIQNQTLNASQSAEIQKLLDQHAPDGIMEIEEEKVPSKEEDDLMSFDHNQSIGRAKESHKRKERKKKTTQTIPDPMITVD